MPRPRLRIPLYFKFLAGCLLLAALLIIGGGVMFHKAEKKRAQSRGNYLIRHFKRYLEYQQGLGRALSSVTDLLANEPLLRQALARRSTEAAAGATGTTGTTGTTGAAGASGTAGASDAIGTTDAIRIATRAFEILRGKHAVQPDLMILVDESGRLVWSRLMGADGATELEPTDLGEMGVVHKVVRGHSYVDKALVHGGRAFQMAGMPVLAPNGDTVVGGILLGVDIRRYMEEYKRLSGSGENAPYHFTFIYKPDPTHPRGQVVSSVMPEDTWPEIEDALSVIDHRQWTYAEEQGDYRQRMVRLSSGEYDVYGPRHPKDKDSASALVTGFAGLEEGIIGELYLLRSRSSLDAQGPEMPVLGILVAVLLSVFVAFILARVITRPIKSFVEQSRKILEGETDLTQRLEVCSRDELQDLAENINRVFERLYGLASEVQGAAFQVGASSAQISAASKQMLTGLKDQTMKIESSTAAVTELSASIQEVAANAAEATKVAEKSNVAVTAAQDRMQEIRGAVEEAADRMRELGDSGKRIGNIVEVIRQISEQTSLLALNASIEAAHAGEQGRGFAVVADEVSSLARRVGQSAKDIEALIQTIKEQTADAVSSMQTGTREVEEGTELVTTTLTDLTNLIHVVKETARAVQEQAVVSDEIARNMDAVQTIATEVLAGSEESVVQAENLHELAFGLERSVGGFNLEGSAGRGAAPLPGATAQKSLPRPGRASEAGKGR